MQSLEQFCANRAAGAVHGGHLCYTLMRHAHLPQLRPGSCGTAARAWTQTNVLPTMLHERQRYLPCQ